MKCRFLKTIYKNEADNFSINCYETDSKGVFIAKGYFLPINSKLQYELEGEWENNPKYGLQLNVSAFYEVLPADRDGMIAYLSSGLIKGIGPKTAERIADHFGPDTLSILDKQPEKLLDIPGITPTNLQEITQSLEETRSMRSLVSLLAPYGISANKISRIFKRFGPCAYDTVSKRPYTLCTIEGFGFKTVDQIAQALGGKATDSLRISSAIFYSMGEAAVAGHLFLGDKQLLEQTYKLLNEGYAQEVVTSSAITEQLNYEAKLGDLILENHSVYLKKYWQAETTIAEKVVEWIQKPPNKLTPNQIQAKITLSEQKFGIKLAQTQRKAIENALIYPLSIITGSPGTGKTTILKVILDVSRQLQPKANILLAAPTGRAARRMTEATQYPADTLHSALGLIPGEERENTLFFRLIICDEFSMCDAVLASFLCSALSSESRLVIIGDSDQLPSVGPGNVLRELIASQAIPTTVLDEIFRQSNQNPIPYNANLVKTGAAAGSLCYNDHFLFIDCAPESAVDLISQLYVQQTAQFGTDQVQVLTCMKKRGKACSQNLNQAIQSQISAHNPSIKIGGSLYHLGDRVIHKRNNDLVNNGDIGTIVDLFFNPKNEPVISVLYSDNRYVEYNKENCGQVELAYALTVHKAQGTESDVIILALFHEQYIMLQRNLVYTAITRAKQKVILVGEREAFNIALSHNKVDKRNTILAERICKHRNSPALAS